MGSNGYDKGPMEAADQAAEEHRTVSGDIPGGLNYLVQAGQAQDIFKDGVSGPSTVQMLLIELKEAMVPEPCPECGCEGGPLLGAIEQLLLEVQKAIQGLPDSRWGEWVEKLFQLLWACRDAPDAEWLEGLRQCPRKGWAGMALLEMRAGLVMEAWSTLHLALHAVTGGDE